MIRLVISWQSLCTVDQRSFAVPLFDQYTRTYTKFEFAGYTGGIWAPQECRYLLPDKHTKGTILLLQEKIRIARQVVFVVIGGCSFTSLQYTLQKGQWESNISVWFRFMFPRNEAELHCHFQNRIIMLCLPISTFMYLCEIYLFAGSVCLFCCSQINRPILGIYKSLADTWMSELGMRQCSFISEKYINRIFGTEQIYSGLSLTI